MKKQHPQTSDESKQDFNAHPDLGTLDGDEVVRFDCVDIRGTVPRELYQQALQAGAAQGLNKSDMLKIALRGFVLESMPLTQHWQNSKARKYNIPIQEVQQSACDAYKRRSYQQKLSRSGES